ncbi:tRNA (adenosine(37)-N6)-threonylcarbamoyltransferase complex transferase subunit TsaD [Apibacter adventoris]|uniref:tRNA (adenosine(37)-N6)-threonylcarbamoyltransferase complex transferase subunit TsaD n=1 Tax=Apibacter adventoris TaxID=1679466 RepID=UPI000CF65327|nr:tRNA (adenosine(37)-N6)-threonylcarbamoyltransferase complex transferase subunit TsaD [Apibacter adventoris]PQL93689.1 tRNA (adenosine(37)-N6)-threonylcarbamoyltransferase complex transferase subunit TsaD [Apibacter adventoris]
MKTPIILGIESSCDDTSAAIIHGRKILSNIVATQKVHENYGGVVPELASRAHQQNIVPVVHQAIYKANISKKQIDAIAFTKGPGLVGSLLVGTSFAKSLSMSLDVPLIEVNHMQGHIFAHFIEDANRSPITFPFLCLTVSGGHTQIVQVNNYFDMIILGETLDDAAGEAFDKIGKLLGLNYPAGPLLDKISQEGNENKYSFPLPKLNGIKFSFSGIKTSVLYFLQKEIKKNSNFINENLNDLCASVQKTIIKALIKKLKEAIHLTGIKNIAIAGGVSANSKLRTEVLKLKESDHCKIFIPKLEYTTDNAAMIAIVGSIKFENQKFTDLSASANARYKI